MIVDRPGQVGQSSLGAVWRDGRVTFSLFSANAWQVQLCLFATPRDAQPERTVDMVREGDVWAVELTDVPIGTAYGYRVHGPFAPWEGHRFNGDRLLLDPYAKAIHGHPTWHAALYDHDRGRPPTPAATPGTTAHLMPRSILIDDTFDWQDVPTPRTRIEDSIIYEVHVKGFTALHPEVPKELQGTYLGLAEPAAIDHLVRLGVTAVELLPVHHFVDDAFLLERGLRNYWGYNSVSFLAPEPRYAASAIPGAAVTEFKTMVRELHRAGIEVILDVVYNHSGETDDRGPTLSFRGIDNSVYYRLDPDHRERYVDVTGCGNTLQVSHPVVRDLIHDSLRYWVEVMGVDGFRFDLAPALARDPISFNAHNDLMRILRDDPTFDSVKLIAEPWDLGHDGYQLGRFAPGWSEWNDQYRDAVRGFWIGSDPRLQEIGARVTGSADLFRSSDRGPTASVNFIASHDGFTLADAIAYPRKRNTANGDRNRDGDPNRIQGARGQVGITRDLVTLTERRQIARSMLAMLLTSQGVPMLLGGDECGRTQSGNNNAYCQDNPISWFDWSRVDEEDELVGLVAWLTRLRRAEQALRLTTYPEARGNLTPEVRWYNEFGAELAWSEWQDHERRCLAMTVGNGLGEDRLLVLMNAGDLDITFRLPSSVSETPGPVERLVSSALRHHASDPVGHSPAGSLQVLRVMTDPAGD